MSAITLRRSPRATNSVGHLTGFWVRWDSSRLARRSSGAEELRGTSRSAPVFRLFAGTLA